MTYAYASCLKFNKNRKLKAVALLSSFEVTKEASAWPGGALIKE